MSRLEDVVAQLEKESLSLDDAICLFETGVSLVEDDEGRTFFARTFAATLSYNPTASLSLFVDGGLQSPEKRAGRAAVILDAGLGYLLTPNVQLDFSAGKGVRGSTSPRAFVSAGVSTRF